MKTPRLAAAGLRILRANVLLVNSVYLMMATAAVAGFGFIFWLVVSHHYAASAVGLTATLLSLSSLLSMFSLAGFDTTFVRFLPRSDRREAHINTGMVVVGVASVTLALGFACMLPITSPKLAFVLHNPLYLASFVFFTMVTSLNVLTNSIFLALKCAKDILRINVTFSVVKVVLPFVFVHGSVMTLFAIAGVSQLVGLALSLLVMYRRLGYVFAWRIHRDILQEVKKYSSSMYVSSILNLLPPTVLPLLIVSRLGANQAAYYYMAFTIASILYTVAYSTMQSVFAEGSHDEASLKMHIVKAGKFVSALLLPAIALTAGLSRFILHFFGPQYARHGGALLQLFAVSAVVVAAGSAMGVIFKVTKHLQGVVIMNIVYAGVIIGVSCLLLGRFGILAVGWAWLIGNAAAAGVGLFLFWRSHGLFERT